MGEMGKLHATVSSSPDFGLFGAFKGGQGMSIFNTVEDTTMDDKTRTELEAAVYRRLVEHLRSRTDVQNIDMMNLAGFCRNCLSNWMKDAADAKGLAMSKDESREIGLRHALRGMAQETPERSLAGAESGIRKVQPPPLVVTICM